MPSKANLPPGGGGLPLVGDTLPALSNMYGYLAKKREQHGAVFRAKVLGKDVVFLSGPAGAEAFLDQEKVTREDAHPPHVRALFGGVNMNMFDGPRHFALKSMALQAFDHAAIAGYLPDIQALIEGRLAELAGRPEIRAVDEARRLAIEAICWNVFGLRPGPETDALREDYVAVATGMLSVPVDLPGTTYRRGTQGRDRVLAKLRQLVADRRANPGSDGLSRLLAARTPEGAGFTDDELVLELHHVVIAGYIVFGLLVELLLQLNRQPDLRQRAADEVRRVSPEGAVTPQHLRQMELSQRLVQEAKRTAPIVPLAFGKARKTFVVNGYTVPEGWDVWWALALSNRDGGLWSQPGAFDPDRYAPPRAEDAQHPHAWVPQGSGPMTGHKCLGFDYSTALAQVFLTLLLRRFTWEIPDQDLEYVWNRTPAEPKDGLRVALKWSGPPPGVVPF